MRNQFARALAAVGRRSGFTVVELLVTLAVVAITLGFAMPGFGQARRDMARTGRVNDLVHAIHLARSEAIKRNGVVSLCPTTDGETCSPQRNWQVGWLVFVNLDSDSPAMRDDDEPLLRAYEAWDAGHILSNRSTLSFRAFGQMGVTATITFCDDRGPDEARAVIISQTGRPRVSERSSSGGPLGCA